MRKYGRKAITAHELCLGHTGFGLPEAYHLGCFVRLHLKSELRDIERKNTVRGKGEIKY